ncbi:4Fe-4S binding protein [Peptoniphilus sp. KCTC 25270]|uniref:indolepyruvate ferredoxin oxidoreductase subunit alpha n=1 Tax=Peptoniphilus sp. KCTC 25270 TaxID=2897414 RepID=UPI001E519B86|nr:4Fe-4S binding protein [Peptoniphilus sp. KCTC 25270]MCD1147964.1 4Fe-4S binding protein [Peptoniphilus sp. KCTC 25270]
MKLLDIFTYVFEELPIGVLSFLGEDYLPKSEVIEIAAAGEGGLYFILNRDNEMARDIIRRKEISFVTYKDGLSLRGTEFINIKGVVKRSDESWDLVKKLNPELSDSYKDEQNQKMVFLFFIHEGEGTIKKKKERAEAFAFGQPKGESYIYEVNNRCVRCMDCVQVCPVDAIKPLGARVSINQNLCVHCSACYKTCAFSAIDRS